MLRTSRVDPRAAFVLCLLAGCAGEAHEETPGGDVGGKADSPSSHGCDALCDVALVPEHLWILSSGRIKGYPGAVSGYTEVSLTDDAGATLVSGEIPADGAFDLELAPEVSAGESVALRFRGRGKEAVVRYLHPALPAGTGETLDRLDAALEEPCQALRVDGERVTFVPRRYSASVRIEPGATEGPRAASLRATDLDSGRVTEGALAADETSSVVLPNFGNTAWSGRAVFRIEFLDERGRVLLEGDFDTGASWTSPRRAADVPIVFHLPPPGGDPCACDPASAG